MNISIENLALIVTTLYSAYVTVMRFKSDNNKQASDAWASLVQPMKDQLEEMRKQIEALKVENSALKAELSNIRAVNDALNRLDRQRGEYVASLQALLKAYNVIVPEMPDNGKVS